MSKQFSSNHFYRAMANGRFPRPVYSRQKTGWLRFLLFCLVGRDTAVPAPQPIPVQNQRQPYPNRY